MASTITSDQINGLSVDEKLKLIQAVWESLLADTAELPTPEWQRKLIRERVEAYRSNPHEGTDAFEFLDQLGRKQ